jgi:peptide/nickel transport system substrate-binding protein
MDEISKQDLEGPVIDRRTTMKLLGGMSAGAIGSVAGCLGQGNGGGTNGGGGGNSSSPASSAETGGKISAGLLTDKVNFLNPHLVTAATQIMIHANIFSGLTKINQKNQIVGDLAKDWSLPDETTYVFKLNEGVKFHNGDTLDAGAAKWSIEQLNTLDESPHKGKIAAIDSMEANGTELTIHLANPVGPFISFMTRGPGRAGTIVHRNAGKQPDKYNRQPIGSGPFELSKRSSGESLTLSKFENYWETDDDGNQLPYLDEINVQLIPEPNTMWSAITSDSIDHTMEISGEFASQARNRPDLQVQSAGAGEYQGVRLLASKPSSHDPKLVQQSGGPQTVSGEWKGKNLPTSDPKVRRALAMAIDREEIIEKGYFGFAVPAHSPYNPTMDWVYE